MSTILVTGGRGFIGSHFVEKCLYYNHKVIDIDCMTYVSSKTLPCDDNPLYIHVKENIQHIKHIPICDIIVNFAAESHVDNSLNSVREFINANILGVANLLDLLRGKVYERPLFVHISTDEVYGDVSEDGSSKTELDILKPSNPYSASKAAAEMLIFSAARSYNIDFQIVRSTNNYGSRQYPEKLIPKILSCLQDNKKIPLHGDGSYYRDWLYVKDNVDAIYKICNTKQINEIWNVSAYNLLTNIEIVQQVCEWYGIKGFAEHINHVVNRLGQDRRYQISSEKLRNTLDWKPKHSELYNFI